MKKIVAIALLLVFLLGVISPASISIATGTDPFDFFSKLSFVEITDVSFSQSNFKELPELFPAYKVSEEMGYYEGIELLNERMKKDPPELIVLKLVKVDLKYRGIDEFPDVEDFVLKRGETAKFNFKANDIMANGERIHDINIELAFDERADSPLGIKYNSKIMVTGADTRQDPSSGERYLYGIQQGPYILQDQPAEVDGKVVSFNIVSIADSTDDLFQGRTDTLFQFYIVGVKNASTGIASSTDTSDIVDKNAGEIGILPIAIGIVVAGIVGAIGLVRIINRGKAKNKENKKSDKETYEDKEIDEKEKAPEFPEFIVGSDGEHMSKKADGTVEASFPNGDVVTYFPNGTAQRRSPDGNTYEEWADGTISTSENGQFIVKKADGTISVSETNGEETIYNPDGTSIETKVDGIRITKDAENNVVSVEKDGLFMTRDPKDIDTFNIASKYGGKLVLRKKESSVPVREKDEWVYKTVIEYEIQGEVRTENETYTYKSDGSQEIKMNDGTIATKDADGNINVLSPDGTDLKYNGGSGEIDYKFPDGSYTKGNSETGELDSKMSDGSYSKRDAKGNGSFYNANNGTKGSCNEDGSFKTENKDGSFTQSSDGTMELKDKNSGDTLVQRPDGSQYLKKLDGTKLDLSS